MALANVYIDAGTKPNICLWLFLVQRSLFGMYGMNAETGEIFKPVFNFKSHFV